MGSKMMKFHNKRVWERWVMVPLVCVAWFALYRVKYVIRLELVEGKIRK